jgi:hypothetical protein
MRTAALTAVFAAALSGPAGDARLTAAALAPGTEIELVSEAGYELRIEAIDDIAGSSAFELSVERRREKTIAVLAGGDRDALGSDRDGGPRAIRVRYELVLDRFAAPGEDAQEEPDPSPLERRAFALERGPRGWLVTDEDGDEVEDELGELVVAEEVGPGDELVREASLFAAAASDRTLREGQEIALAEELAREVLALALGEDVEHAAGTLTFEGTREHHEGEARCAVFAVELEADGEVDGELEVALELSGELWLEQSTARLCALELEGPVRVAGAADDERGVELDGEGTVRLVMSARYAGR